MNPSTSCRDQIWWKTPWLIEAKGVNLGGFCDVNVDELSVVDLDFCLDEDETVHNATSLELEEVGEEESLEESDVAIARAEVQETMSNMYNDLLYCEERRESVDPTVSYEGKKMYKTTLISQLNDNPHLSKDRLTRVKSSLYFNNLVDKPKVQDGSPTMFIHVGTECV